MREPDRDLPHNLDAEVALLGGVLIDNRLLEACDHLRPEAFYVGFHKLVFEAILGLRKSNRAADVATVHAWLFDHHALSERQRLMQMVANAARFAKHVADHAHVIRDASIRREMIAVCDQMRELAAHPPEGSDGADVVSRAEAALRAVAKDGGPIDAWSQIGEAGELALAEIEAGKSRGVSTGFQQLDQKLGGLRPGEVIILGARPSMGKSVTARALAYQVAAQNKGAMVWSCEMSRDVSAMAMACAIADTGVRYLGESESPTISDALANRMNDRQRRLLREALARLRTLPFYVDDRPNLTMPQIQAAARRKVREWEKAGIEPGVLLIDYLQKVRPHTDRKGARHLEVADLSAALRPMGYELGIPIVALAQVGRGVENRDDKRPHMADLRESGDIEQDADVIAFLFREAYYLERQGVEEDAEAAARLRQVRHELEIIIAKQRNGPIGTVRLFIDTQTGAIRNLEQRA